MAAIAAQMNCDAVRPCLFTNHGGGHDTRLRRAPRLTHRGDVIDIDVQSCCHLFAPGSGKITTEGTEKKGNSEME
jgi:ribosomal protein L31